MQCGAHSLKVAGFSGFAEVRLQWGCQTGHNEEMTLLYSCDAVASPLRQYESVLAAILSNVFRPDVTRSGYFMNTGPSDVVEDPGDEVQPGPKQGDSVNHSSTNSSSSSFAYSR